MFHSFTFPVHDSVVDRHAAKLIVIAAKFIEPTFYNRSIVKTKEEDLGSSSKGRFILCGLPRHPISLANVSRKSSLCSLVSREGFLPSWVIVLIAAFLFSLGPVRH